MPAESTVDFIQIDVANAEARCQCKVKGPRLSSAADDQDAAPVEFPSEGPTEN